MVLRRICGTSLVREIKSMKMRWVRILSILGEMRNPNRILVLKSKGRSSLGRPRHRDGIILKWILNK
jgi:hypothetical protein